MQTIIVALVILVGAFVIMQILYGTPGILRKGSQQALSIEEEVGFIPGQEPIKRLTAPADIHNAYESMVDLFKKVKEKAKTSSQAHCLLTYDAFPEDFQGFTIEIEQIPGEVKSNIELKNKEGQLVSREIIDGVEPCIIGGEWNEWSGEKPRQCADGRKLSPLAAQNFHKNWIDPKRIKDSSGKAKIEAFCKPEYRSDDVIITGKEKIKTDDKTYRLADKELKYPGSNGEFINLLYVPESGRSCFLVYNRFADHDSDGIDDDFPILFHKDFFNEEGTDANEERGTAPIPLC